MELNLSDLTLVSETAILSTNTKIALALFIILMIFLIILSVIFGYEVMNRGDWLIGGLIFVGVIAFFWYVIICPQYTRG